MSKGTPLRAVRVDPNLWNAAKDKARERGESLSEVIRRALTLYAEDQHPTMSDYPTPAKNAHIANCPQCQVTFG